MKKNTYFFKQLACLLAFLFLGSASVINTYSLHAATIEDFPETDFWIVDRTTPDHTDSYGIQSNPTGIIGYYYKGNNEYQLTDTVPGVTVAMWNKNQIDLNQDWEFDFRLFFDTGTIEDNQSIPVGSRNRHIADGIVFVLHKFDTAITKSMIGSGIWYMGYGYTQKTFPPPTSNGQQSSTSQKHHDAFQASTRITPSFAIEFDTEFVNGNEPDFYFDEGGDTVGCHVAYLKNGNMTALPGTYKPMQNNWANVGRSDWFDVKIVWRKGYANNTPYYDLLTYIKEKDSLSPQRGQMLLRNSKRFHRLNEVIAGLTVDENCQALATWGFTSATCWNPNLHAVQFVKLEAARKIPHTITAAIAGYCRDETYYPMATTQSTSSHYEYQDTILQPIDVMNCFDNGIKFSSGDTIEYTISCADTNISKWPYCNHNLELYNIPNKSQFTFYLNDSLIGTTLYDASISHGIWRCSLQPWYFDNNLTTRIKIVIDNVEYNFKILYDDYNITWIKQLAQTTDIQIDAALHVGTLELNNTNLTQSIQLPTLAGCQNAELLYPQNTDSIFVVSPIIDSNNVLTFELKPYICNTKIFIKSQCNCDENFTLTVANTSCSDYLCDLIHIGEMYREAAPVSSNGHTRLPGMKIMYEVWIEDQDNHGRFIDTTVATELATDAPDISFIDKVFMKPFGNNALEITFLGCDGEYIYKKYEICATLDNGITCCDTFEFHDTCHGIRSWIELNATTAGVIDYELAQSEHYQPGWDIQPIPPVYGILEVRIYDFTGTLLQSMNLGYVAEGATGTIYYNTTFYPIGYAVFFWKDKIKIIKLLNN